MTLPACLEGAAAMNVSTTEFDPLLGSMASLVGGDPMPTSLGPGSEVHIGGCSFKVSTLLGEGSFGAVWGARSAESRVEVAVKEIVCRSDTELLRAHMERQLLQFVGQELPQEHRRRGGRGGGSGGSRARDQLERPAVAAAYRFPALVVSEVQVLGSDLWQVRLAMSRLQGKPLESLLETAMAEQLQIPQAVNGELQLPSAECSASGNLVEVSRCVKDMLMQLSPALEHLSSKAYHRDITPRNVLVDVQGRQHQYGLVDFGLAVDSSRWREEMLTHDIGGDGHYWPTSSWFVLAHGAHHLESFPALQHEYATCLDLHALGITALRALMELWDSKQLSDSSGTLAWGQIAKMMRLRIAWTRYWDDVARFWQPIFDSFACGGADALERLKTQYGLAGVHRVVSADLCGVRAALLGVRDAAAIPDLRTVCEVLLVMIRPGKPRQDNPTWETVRQVFEAAAAAGEGERTHRSAQEQQQRHTSPALASSAASSARAQAAVAATSTPSSMRMMPQMVRVA